MPLAAGPRAEWTELGEQLIARVKAKQQLQQGKLKKETVRCNICQRVLINDKRNLLDHCKLYHMNA